MRPPLTAAALAFALCACGSDTSTMMPMPDGGQCLPPTVRPGARDAHDAVLAPSLGPSGAVLVFGGDAAPFDPSGMTPAVYLDELWSWDVACGTWTMVPTSGGPGRRGAYASAWDGKRNRMLLVGGRSNEGGYKIWSDVWALDPAKGSWSALAPTGTSPGARQSHRVVYDAARDRLILFGGNGATFFGSKVLGDTWELSFAAGSDGAWRKIAGSPSPSARQDHAFAIDPTRNQALLFGGAFDFSTYSDETWSFDLATDVWKQLVTIDQPSPRFWGELVADPARRGMILFAGHDAGAIGLRNDTWGWDGAAWHLLASGDRDLGVGNVDKGSPERRSKQSLVALGDRAVLFGGISDCGPLDDLWTFDLPSRKWKNPFVAMVGETCARRATGSQSCASDCGPPQ